MAAPVLDLHDLVEVHNRLTADRPCSSSTQQASMELVLDQPVELLGPEALAADRRQNLPSVWSRVPDFILE